MNLNIDVQAAFDLMLNTYILTAPLALVFAICSRVFRAFIDMVSGRDTVRL